jgi:hypothetical protein
VPDYRNPFIVGRPVPPERFIGREREVEAILDRLAGPAPDSTAVSGEALIGKTSLLHYISSPEIAEKWGLSPEKCTFIFVDSQTIVPFSPKGFWHYVLKSLAAREVHDPGYIDGLLKGDDIEGFELGELFDRIARDGKLVVLLLDEFEHVVEHVNLEDPQFLYLLRALINRPAYGLALVLASRKPLHVLCQNMRPVGSPFPTSFTLLSLGPFSEGEANQLIDLYTQDTGVTFSDRDREFAYEISKGHPYWLQETCFKLFQRHVEKMTQRLDDSDYRKIAEEIEKAKAETEAKAIPEEREDKGRRLEVTPKVYLEGTWAIAFWISFTLSGLTLAFYLLASYAPLLWISAFFAAIWFVLLVISRFIPRSSV